MRLVFNVVICDVPLYFFLFIIIVTIYYINLFRQEMLIAYSCCSQKCSFIQYSSNINKETFAHNSLIYKPC